MTISEVVRKHLDEESSIDEIEDRILDELVDIGIINNSKDYEVVLPTVRRLVIDPESYNYDL